MKDFKKHLISENSKIKDVLLKLDKLSIDSILFVVDKKNKLLGSFTDGDIRRGLINNFSIDNYVTDIIQKNPKFLYKNINDLNKLIHYRNENYKIIPILNEDNEIVDIINFRIVNSLIPVDTCIMAGGLGKRLLPATKNTPKPLLKINNKPIIQYNLERLRYFGINRINISVNYLGDKIKNFFGNGSKLDLNINYVNENKPLGTMGSLKNINKFYNESILIMNSDILTNIDFEDFYIDFKNHDADMSIVTNTYQVKVPYGIFEFENNMVKSIKEKPTYNYDSNAGIYLIKKGILNEIEKNKFLNATDLILKLIKKGYKVINYKFPGYWIDIGKPDDFEKAKKDINNIKFY